MRLDSIIISSVVLCISQACFQPPEDQSRSEDSTLRLIKVASVDDLFNDGAVVHVRFQTRIGLGESLFFAVHEPSVVEARPLLLRRSRPAGWRAWTVEGGRLQNKGWRYVGRSVDGSELFAVLDCEVAGPSSELQIILSNDNGTTWALGGSVRKPYRFAILSDVSMRAGASGSLTVWLDEDYGTGHPPGYYSYSTDDGGQSWSEPTYSPRFEDEITELRIGLGQNTIRSRDDLKKL